MSTYDFEFMCFPLLLSSTIYYYLLEECTSNRVQKSITGLAIRSTGEGFLILKAPTPLIRNTIHQTACHRRELYQCLQRERAGGATALSIQNHMTRGKNGCRLKWR